MIDRPRLAAGGHFDDIVAHEVAGTMGEGEATARAVTVPGAGLERDQVVTEIEVNWNALAARPFLVGVEQERFGLRCRRRARICSTVRCHHGSSSSHSKVRRAPAI